MTLPYVAALPPTPLAPGFTFVAACTVLGFTDPSSGACLNASDPAAALCAFGAADGCVPCPTAPDGALAALCPGGYLAWPLPGWWSPDGATAALAACAPPAADRCRGWDATLAAVRCGPAYVQGSPLCGACAPGYAAAPYSTYCLPCLASPGLAAPALGLAGAAAGAWLLAAGGALAATAATGGTPASAAVLAARFLRTAALALQTAASVLVAAAPGLPAAYAAAVTGYGAALLLALPPTQPGACSQPLLADGAALLGAAFALAAALLLVVAPQPLRRCLRGLRARRCCSRGGGGGGEAAAAAAAAAKAAAPGAAELVAARAGEALLAALLLLYAPVANRALRLVHCDAVSATGAAYMALGGGGAALGLAPGGAAMEAVSACASGGAGACTAEAAAALASTVRFAVLHENAAVVCWEGAHASSGGLAAAALAVLVLALPLAAAAATALWLRRRLRAPASPAAAAALSDAALEGGALAAARGWDAARAAAYRDAAPARSGRRHLRALLARCCGVGRSYAPGPGGGVPVAAAVRAAAGADAAQDEAALSRAVIRRAIADAGLRGGKPPSGAGGAVIITAADVLDHSARLRAPPSAARAAVGAEYRASAWPLVYGDLAALLALQAILVLWQAPASPASAAGRLLVTWAVLAGDVAARALARPYAAAERWRGWLRDGAAAVAGLAAL